MKHLLLCMLFLSSICLYAQNEEAAKKLIREGIQLHDAHKYDKAIKKYEKALKEDKNNIVALIEIGITYTEMGNYNKAIDYCKKTIELHPDSEYLGNVYVQYGTCYDMLKKPKKAIRTYEEGIVAFPDYYLLHFNKGITQVNVGNVDRGLVSFQNAIKFNPNHSSSHFYIGLIEADHNHKVPSIMALSRFITLEPTGSRATKASQLVLELMSKGVTKNEDGSINISIDALTVDNMNKETVDENDFSSVETLLSLTGALTISEEHQKELEDSLGITLNDVDMFQMQYSSMCSMLDETNKESNNKGFYWEYYVPYFVDMKTNEQTLPMSYLLHISSGEKFVGKWFKKNEEALKSFLEWSNDFWEEEGTFEQKD